jgi:hypothetical protein
MISNTTHKLLEFVKVRTSHVLHISFKDSEVFLLKELNPIDPSIYNSNGQWTAEIAGIIHIPAKKQKLLKLGIGLDFKEADVTEIIDTTTGESLYRE